MARPDEPRAGARARRGAARAAALLASLGAALSASGPAQADASGFPAWVAAFRAEAAAAGVAPATLDAAFAPVRYDPKVIELDGRQPEFVTPIWVYLDRLASDARVADGRAAAARAAAPLAAIEARYRVPASVVAAIWGVESNFGGNRGSFDVVEALATLAYEGRRRDFWKQQLVTALQIMQRGDAGPGRLTGSWAGAMGHTQFIPTSFEAHAVDFTGDGRRDIWGDDPTDALASTANYLAEAGWRPGEPSALAVRLPTGFDFGAGAEARLSTAEWSARGVTLADGRPLPIGLEDARLLVPAGAAGPAFLALPNFRAIKRYNNSDFYALAVGQLAERIAGGAPQRFAWPTDDLPLARKEAETLQRALTALGYDTGGVDGVLGPNSRAAIRRFQAETGRAPDGYASATLLGAVRRAVELRGTAGDAPLDREAVRELQELLARLGHPAGPADGLPGAKTQAAIAKFLSARKADLPARPIAAVLAEARIAAADL